MDTLTDDQATALLAFVRRIADDIDPEGVPEGGFDQHGAPLDADGGYYTIMDFSHGEDYAHFMSAIAGNRQSFMARGLLDELGLLARNADPA